MSDDFSGLIPINPNDLTTEYKPVDDSIPYNVIVKKFEMATKPDRNGGRYFTGQYEVLMPEEWAGRVVFESYMAVPVPLTEDMSYGERRAAQDKGVNFARFCKCFKVALDEKGFDPSSVIGLTGDVTVKNEEFNGQITTKVKRYLF